MMSQNQDPHSMQKQIENLKNQVITTTHNHQSLEQIEAALILKLDKKEAENYQLKRMLQNLKDDLIAKTEGCQKA